MPSAPNVSTRLRYLASRARRIQVGSLIERARETANAHNRNTAVVLGDMLWSAARHNVGFQDYVDFDFAMLTAEERATFMTHPISNQISQRHAAPASRGIFHDKIAFNRRFSEFLGREWLDLTVAGPDELATFTAAHPVLIAKTPGGSAGIGVRRYDTSDVTDFVVFHADLISRGELLVEEVITQHPDLAAYCPGTVNTTRVTAFFDGSRTHILAAAQKFGRGAVSDQMSYGGFYTMLDDNGHAVSAGYDSHGHVHEKHPESGLVIADFQLPLWPEVVAFVERIAQVVPDVAYVGWDIVVTPQGPVVIEGNWGAGVYENKPSVSGIRTGHRERYRAATGI